MLLCEAEDGQWLAVTHSTDHKKGLQTGEGVTPCGQPWEAMAWSPPAAVASYLLPWVTCAAGMRVGGGPEPSGDTVATRPVAARCVYNLCIGMEVKVLVPTSGTQVCRRKASGPAPWSLAFLGSPGTYGSNG